MSMYSTVFGDYFDVVGKSDDIEYAFNSYDASGCCGAGILGAFAVSGKIKEHQVNKLYKDVAEALLVLAGEENFSLITAYSVIPGKVNAPHSAYFYSAARFSSIANIYGLFQWLGVEPSEPVKNTKTGNLIVGFHCTVDQIEDKLDSLIKEENNAA